MCETRSQASIACSSRSKMSFQRITTIGSMPRSNRATRAWRLIHDVVERGRQRVDVLAVERCNSRPTKSERSCGGSAHW
jgi:hypothetical protein